MLNTVALVALFVVVVAAVGVNACGMPPAPPPPPAPCCAAPPPPPAPCCGGRRKRQSYYGQQQGYNAYSAIPRITAYATDVAATNCVQCSNGRKKREAVQPVFKTEETPCPQSGWKNLMEEKLSPEDAATSVNDIQLGLFNRFPEDKFLVICALAGDENSQKAAQTLILPNKVSLSSRGDGYCNVVKGRIWCQAVSLSA